MLLQFLSFLYSVLFSCVPLLHALFTRFTASLPNLTVRLLIRRSVSQAVLSFCLNIHLLSVYLHLHKNLPGLAYSALPLSFFSYLSGCLPFGFSFSIYGLMFFARSMFNLTVVPFAQAIHTVFFSKRQMALESVSHRVAYCKLLHPSCTHLVSFTQTSFDSKHTNQSRRGELKRGRKSQ